MVWAKIALIAIVLRNVDLPDALEPVISIGLLM
jgi:hypothetical protein